MLLQNHGRSTITAVFMCNCICVQHTKATEMSHQVSERLHSEQHIDPVYRHSHCVSLCGSQTVHCSAGACGVVGGGHSSVCLPGYGQ